MISLDEYIQNMKPEQKNIYYIAAESVSSAKNTPFLERLLEKDLEVWVLFFLTDTCVIFFKRSCTIELFFFLSIVL